MIRVVSGIPMRYEYEEKNREGDHICYYSDLRKMMRHYPAWAITIPLNRIFEEIHHSWVGRN